MESAQKCFLGKRGRSLGTTPISGKTLSEREAIFGVLGEFQGTLGAALGIRNFIVGMASHDLGNTKSRIQGRALYGPVPVKTETFRELWAPLVHTNFGGEIHMDQSLVHTFSWGNSYGPMVLRVFLKFPPTLALVHGWLFPGILRGCKTLRNRVPYYF